MAKAAAADDAKPMGVCEKLFNALSLSPSFRPVRRLTHREHSPDAAARPPSSAQNTYDDLKTGTSNKPDRRPQPAAPPKALPGVPVPVPPKAVVAQQAAAEEESEEKRKNINEKAAEFIERAKIKIRSSTFGRTRTTKKTS